MPLRRLEHVLWVSKAGEESTCRVDEETGLHTLRVLQVQRQEWLEVDGLEVLKQELEVRWGLEQAARPVEGSQVIAFVGGHLLSFKLGEYEQAPQPTPFDIRQ